MEYLRCNMRVAEMPLLKKMCGRIDEVAPVPAKRTGSKVKPTLQKKVIVPPMAE